MVPKNKDELLSEINKHFYKFLNTAKKINLENIHKKNIIWHKKDTFISAHNLVSYLNWRVLLVIKWIDFSETNIDFDMPETWYKWNQLWDLAIKFYDDFKDINYENLLLDLEKNYEIIIKIIQSKSNENLYEINWYTKYTLWRMIQFNTSSPCKNAYLKIKKFYKM